MSTLKTTNIQHPSAASPAVELTAAGGLWLGGGKVLQTVTNTYSTSTAIASTTYTDTGASITITPSSATSKILFSAQITCQIDSTTTDDTYGYMRLMRDGSEVIDYGFIMRQRGALGVGSVVVLMTTSPITYLDSPATTSAVTYSLQAKVNNTASSRKITAQYAGSPTVMFAQEVSA